MSDNKKTKRKVLVVSCLLAALIVGSSTFAWFTSIDEVTNKLSANNKYDVVAVEDFIPPTNWIPGQKVEKDVRTTNTGNIDAFVKVNLTSDMYLTKFDNSVAVTAANKSTVLPKGLELTTADEKIRSKMAGSRLIYKPDAAAATDGYDYNESDLQDGGVTVDLNNSEAVNVDSSSGSEFVPTSTGYYIFARSTTENSDDGTRISVLYDGFYYDSTSVKYYDIEVVSDSNNIYTITAKLRQTKSVFVDNDAFTYAWVKEKDTDAQNNLLRLTYVGESAEDEDNIVIDIKLVNQDYWTKNLENGNKTAAFYYNYVLEAGTSSRDLTDYVVLNKDVQKDAFITMDYNLKVTMNSAQVASSEDKLAAVNAQTWASAAGTKSVSAVDDSTLAVTWTDNT